MIITVECPDCHTTFPVDPRKVPDGGVKVRCSACSGIFFVEKPEMPAVVTVPVPVPSGGGGAPENEVAPRTASPAPAAAAGPEKDAERAEAERAEAERAEAERAELPAEDDRDNVDPWSGADWDDPAEMGAPHPDPADPWSGGMGLHDDVSESDPVDDAPSAAWDEAELEEPAPAWDEAEVDEPVAAPAPSEWVVEQSSPVAFEEPKAPVERLETIEEQVRSAAEAHDTGLEHDDDLGEWDEAAIPPAAEAPVDVDDEVAAQGSGSAAAMAEAAEEAVGRIEAAEATDEMEVEDVDDAVATVEAEVDEPEVGGDPAAEARPAGFQFGKRDPHEKARRLARVLVSDMITYNPERHQRALEQGTLHADFEDEIRKSWAEYTDQVGRELAETTSYWFDALNEILARGEKVF